MGMLTPKEIASLRFHSRETLLGGWYDADEVDEALEDIEHTVAQLRGLALMHYVDVSNLMTRDYIRNIAFRTRNSGNAEWYSAGQVDAFLDRCSDAVHHLSIATLPFAPKVSEDIERFRPVA